MSNDYDPISVRREVVVLGERQINHEPGLDQTPICQIPLAMKQNETVRPLDMRLFHLYTATP